MIAIVVSRADSASEHIGEQLLELATWTEHADESRSDADGGGTVYRLEAANGELHVGDGDDADDHDDRDGRIAGDETAFELRTFDAMHLDLERAADAFDDPDLLFFVSRHSGDTGPLLTCHFTGNFGPAKYGGSDRTLARACPKAQKALVDAFADHAPDDYEVGIECTHHGPSDVGVPSMFVELGSDESEWADPAGARAVARGVLDVAGVDADGDRHLVGFGGGHYVPRFLRLLRETAWSVGHLAADWQLDELGDPRAHRDVIRQVFERSAAGYAIVEGTHPAVETAIDDLGYRLVSETWVREVDDRPLSLVERLESELTTVENGLRFGEVEVGPDADVDADDAGRVAGGENGSDHAVAAELALCDLPAELLAEAHGVDQNAARDAVAARTVAFETDQNGARANGRAAFAAGDADSVGEDAADGIEDYDALVDALADILREKYDRVEFEDDAVVAHESAFDPEKARTLGVPEGPGFGKLSSGRAVEVNGRRIPPEEVHTDRTHRFPY